MENNSFLLLLFESQELVRFVQQEPLPSKPFCVVARQLLKNEDTFCKSESKSMCLTLLQPCI